jgi:hypothetical protein
MLGAVTLPIRLVARALDDMHDIAQAIAVVPSIRDEIRTLRVELQDLPERVDGLRDAFEGSNRELDHLNDQVGDVRGVVEPLEPAAERLGRLAKRLPGGGS